MSLRAAILSGFSHALGAARHQTVACERQSTGSKPLILFPKLRGAGGTLSGGGRGAILSRGTHGSVLTMPLRLCYNSIGRIGQFSTGQSDHRQDRDTGGPGKLSIASAIRSGDQTNPTHSADQVPYHWKPTQN